MKRKSKAKGEKRNGEGVGGGEEGHKRLYVIKRAQYPLKNSRNSIKSLLRRLRKGGI